MPRIREFRWDSWAQWAARKILEDMPAAVAVDTETSGMGWHDEAFCATLTWRTQEGALRSAYIDLEAGGREDRIALLKGILMWSPTWVFWNAKFDLQKLDYIGALPALEGHTIEDGQPIASLLNENRRMGLKVRAVEDLGFVDTIEVEVKSGPNKGKKKRVAKEEHHLAAVRRKLKLKKKDGYHLLPREALIPYALNDTELTLRWWEKHRPLLPPDLEPVYAEELEVMHVLRGMEANGVGIDEQYLDATTDEYGAAVMRAWLKLAELSGKPDFKDHHIQVKAAFAALGAHLESTDKAHIRDLLADDKTTTAVRTLAEALHEYREVEKIHGTYLTSLRDEQRDGVAHPWFNSVGPRTGRTSSSQATN